MLLTFTIGKELISFVLKSAAKLTLFATRHAGQRTRGLTNSIPVSAVILASCNGVSGVLAQNTSILCNGLILLMCFGRLVIYNILPQFVNIHRGKTPLLREIFNDKYWRRQVFASMIRMQNALRFAPRPCPLTHGSEFLDRELLGLVPHLNLLLACDRQRYFCCRLGRLAIHTVLLDFEVQVFTPFAGDVVKLLDVRFWGKFAWLDERLMFRPSPPDAKIGQGPLAPRRRPLGQRPWPGAGIVRLMFGI